MANPLIVPPSRRELMAQIGRESRELNRQKEDEKIIRTAIRIFQQYLPEMLEDPPYTGRFPFTWPHIDQALQAELKSERAYRRAYNHICSRLEYGNCHGIWSLDVPEPYLTLRRQRPARTLRWQEHSRIIAEAEVLWREKTVTEDNPNRAFARVLLAMILYGGLNRPDLWPEIARSLTQARPLHGTVDCCWLMMTLPPTKSRPSNHYSTAGSVVQAMTQVAYMPDPVSLGLIRQFLQCRPADWVPPKTEKMCLGMICAELDIQCSRGRLSHGGITVAELQPGVRLPQALVEFAIGRQASASLPEHYWQRFLEPGVFPCLDVKYQAFSIPDLKGKSRTNAKKANSSTSSLLAAKLKAAFKKDPARPAGKSQYIKRLKHLDTPDLSLNGKILVEWLLHHIDARDNAISTTKLYLENIGNVWLAATENENLEDFTGDDFYDLYQSILNRPVSLKAREYQAGRLEDLHQFAVLHHDLPALPTPLVENSSIIPHVSAAIVDEKLFGALIQHIGKFTDLDEYNQRMIKCFLIMAYRTGLRPGELAKLRLKDREPSPVSWLFIRNNRFGHNKTEAALRKVPLFPLLTDQEASLIKHYLAERQFNSKSHSELIFHTAGNYHEPLDTKVLSIAVKTILSASSGGLKYRLYHLRHSALSRMQLLLHHDQVTYPDFLDAQLPYSVEQRKSILELVAGRGRIRDRYDALAAMAGHSSPEITFSTYLHYTDLLLGLHLSQNATQLTPELVQRFLGLRPHRVKQLTKDGRVITPVDTADYLRKRMQRYIKVVRRHTPEVPENNSEITVRPSHYQAMLAILGKIQNGQDHRETAWFYQLDETTIERWVSCAVELRNLKTRTGFPRLFPKKRCDQLLPADPIDIDEKHDLDSSLKACRDIYKESNENIRFFIEYFLTHSLSSRSGIRFEVVEDLNRFMENASKIFPWKRWHLKVQSPDGGDITQWNCNNKLSISTTPLLKRTASPVGTSFLYLRHKNEKKKTQLTGYQQYSSATLRILTHRLAIIFFDKKEIQDWNHIINGFEISRTHEQTPYSHVRKTRRLRIGMYK